MVTAPLRLSAKQAGSLRARSLSALDERCLVPAGVGQGVVAV